MHGLEKIAPKAGSHALLIGAGPTGLMMAQFLYETAAPSVFAMISDS